MDQGRRCLHNTHYDHQPVHHAVQLGFLLLDLSTVPHNFGIKSWMRNILEVKTQVHSTQKVDLQLSDAGFLHNNISPPLKTSEDCIP